MITADKPVGVQDCLKHCIIKKMEKVLYLYTSDTLMHKKTKGAYRAKIL